MKRAHWEQQGRQQEAKPVHWTKRMSDHIAFALLVYTGLHIFVTMQVLEGEGTSILPYFALVLLVGAIIPGCRVFEQRWEALPASGAPDEVLRRLFYRDLALLWIVAIGLPIVITFLARALLAAI
jgi:hypothetical protein